MAFSIDAAQKAIRDRVDFRVLRLPAFHPELGTSIRDPDLDDRLEELTTYFTVFAFIVPRTEILRVPSIEAALASGTKDFCLIQNAGHLFFGQTDFALDMAAALEACAFLMGRIHDRGGYFYLDEQCLLVDRRAWEKLGRPSFGTPQSDRQDVAIPDFAPGPAGFGDLKPSTRGTLPLTARFGYGWNAISASLAGGQAVRQWPATLDRWHLGCAAYLEDIGTWRADLTGAVLTAPAAGPAGLRAYVETLRRRFMANADSPPVFVFNSEADLDIPVISLRNGVDAAFVLAAGFKSNRILETLGFHDGTDVVFYDYSAAALALKELSVEEWDGTDFGGFFTAIRPRLEAMFPRKLTYMQPEALASVEALNREFQAEMRAVFASPQQWQRHWQRFRRLKHHYVQIDLLAAPDQARAMIASHARGDAAMWVSDMFNAPYAVGTYSFAHRDRAFAGLSAALAEKTDADLLIGGAPALWRPAAS